MNENRKEFFAGLQPKDNFLRLSRDPVMFYLWFWWMVVKQGPESAAEESLSKNVH